MASVTGTLLFYWGTLFCWLKHEGKETGIFKTTWWLTILGEFSIYKYYINCNTTAQPTLLNITALDKFLFQAFNIYLFCSILGMFTLFQKHIQFHFSSLPVLHVWSCCYTSVLSGPSHPAQLHFSILVGTSTSCKPVFLSYWSASDLFCILAILLW